MKLILCLVAFLFITNSFAQTPDYMIQGSHFEQKICNIHKHLHSDELLAEPVSKNYDVKKYQIFLDWYAALNSPEKPTKTYSGINSISLTIQEETDRLLFDAQSTLIIDSVFVDNIKWTDFQKMPELLSVNFSSPLSPETDINVKIYFKFSSEQSKGFYLFNKPASVSYNYNPEVIAYTMSEPDDARYWVPCSDLPSDKAIVEISGKVPTGFEFISNGLLQSTENGDNYTIFHWKSAHPMATYLMVANASKYIKLTQSYPLNNQSGNIEIQHYVWAQDTVSNGVLDANKTFANFPEMMSFFEQNFGDYPFEKYAHICVAPFSFGGMEHQTATSVHRNWLTGNVSHGIAHELAHHWLGDLITCNSWQDIWINEGGATWSEALFLSSWDPSYYEGVLRSYANRYFMDNEVTTAIRQMNTYEIFGSQYTLAYYKSGWFYHMMSEMVGKDNFLAALRGILDRYKYQSVSTDMFKEALKDLITNPPIDWDTFFYQWLDMPGHPIYKIGYKTEEYSTDSLKVFVSIDQQQINKIAPEFYKMPIRFKLTDGNDNIIFISNQFINDKQHQLFDFIAPKGFNFVEIDPMSVLHKSIGGTYSLVESKDDIRDSKIFPNVLKNGEYATLLYHLPAGSFHSVKLYDLNGNYIKTIFEGTISSSDNELRFLSEQLSTGAYFVKILSGNFTDTKAIYIVE